VRPRVHDQRKRARGEDGGDEAAEGGLGAQRHDDGGVEQHGACEQEEPVAGPRVVAAEQLEGHKLQDVAAEADVAQLAQRGRGEEARQGVVCAGQAQQHERLRGRQRTQPRAQLVPGRPQRRLRENRQQQGVADARAAAHEP
jgi:hypothetical protein